MAECAFRNHRHSVIFFVYVGHDAILIDSNYSFALQTNLVPKCPHLMLTNVNTLLDVSCVYISYEVLYGVFYNNDFLNVFVAAGKTSVQYVYRVRRSL